MKRISGGRSRLSGDFTLHSLYGWAGNKTLPGDVVADSTGPVTSGDQQTITSRITVTPEQAAGKYQTTLTYTAAAWF